MKANIGITYAQLDIKASLVLGSVVDVNVEKLERVVANYYGVSVLDLKSWTNDSEAKKVMCFLLHHYLNYSIGSIASVYNINRLFLRNCIVNKYVSCLQDASEKAIVDGFVNSITSNVKSN